MADFLKKITAASSDQTRKSVIRDIVPKRTFEPPPRQDKKFADKRLLKPRVQAEPQPKKLQPKPAGEDQMIVHAWKPTPAKYFAYARVLKSRWTWGASAFVAFVLLVAVITTVFASAVITIRPVSAEISIPALSVTADPGVSAISPQSRSIPALRISTESIHRVQSAATGKKYIEEPARGIIKIFNAFDSRPQTLVRTTRFMDPDGKIFKLTNTITVPGAKIEGGKIVPSQIEAEVAAEKPGVEYNIEPSRFTIPGFKGTPRYEGFYGESAYAMKGGFRGEAQIATAEDVRRAQETATRELFDKLREDLERKIPAAPELMTLDGSRRIEVTGITSPKSGEPGNEFTVEVTGVAEAIVFKKSDLFELLGTILLSPERPSKLIEDFQRINLQDVKFNVSKGSLSFAVSGNAAAARIIPVQEILNASLATDTQRFEAYLRGRPEVGGFSIDIFPFWKRKIPSEASAVEIKIELPVGGSS